MIREFRLALLVDCPVCGAQVGWWCRQSGGRLLRTRHEARGEAAVLYLWRRTK